MASAYRKTTAVEIGAEVRSKVGSVFGTEPRPEVGVGSATASAVLAEGLGYSYDGQIFALQGVGLRIAPGEFVAILGGNGSGKSTFAKHIDALLIPDEGTVHVLGHDTNDPQAAFEVRPKVGMVFQNPDDQLVASLVENEVAFGPENLGVPMPELRERVDAALNAVGIVGFQKREVSSLSGGQKQRVAVAGALAMHPEILVLDEVTAMLDPQGRRELMELCLDLHRSGKTIVLITHLMEEAALADRVVVLDDGHIAFDGTPDQVLLNAEALAELNLDAPFACRLALALREAGVDVKPCLTTDELKEELCRLHSKA